MMSITYIQLFIIHQQTIDIYTSVVEMPYLRKD